MAEFGIKKHYPEKLANV